MTTRLAILAGAMLGIAGTAFDATAASYSAAATTTAASAQPSPQQKLMAKRAAELDAYRLMAERVLGLELSSGTKVEDFVTSRDEIRTGVEGFLRSVRIVEVRHFADGTAEADAELTIRQVIEEMKKIRDEVYKDGRWVKEDFEEISRRTQDKVIRVTGSGAARAESDLPDPATQPILPPRVSGQPIEVTLPAIYSKYPPAERLKAKRAAELDGYRKLLERIGRLQLSSGTRVKDFLTESDQIRTSVEGRLRGARIDSVRYAPDGVVEVHMTVTMEQVIETIKKVRDEVYKDGRWTKEDFEDISRHTVRKAITVIGTGALDTGGRPVQQSFDGGDPEVMVID